MKYLEIQKYLEKLKIFSVEDLRIIDPNYDKSKISKWIKSWYIKKIIRWFYTLNSIPLNQNSLFSISNKIYSPSYISLEMAFCYYGIIPEQVFNITAVSTQKTISFDTDIGSFSYKKIKSELFWWYKIVKIGENRFLIAELEKAFIDYFYLHSTIKSIEDLEALRLNIQVLNKYLDIKKLNKYWHTINSNALNNKINLLITYLNND